MKFGHLSRVGFRLSATAAITVALLVAAIPAAAAPPEPQPTASGDGWLTKPVVLAHYYIWFTPGSWNRAKKDLPQIGRYSSDDIDVMKQHVTQAKAAGIDGFIVSWKSTPVLNQRLANLIAVAEELSFKLAITYQGLDFNRKLLPTPRMADDLDTFARTYGGHSTFDIFGKPLVVITGTPVMSEQAVAALTGSRRRQLLILSSEKSVDGYERIASRVDGNLYYWSSVNPRTFGKYPEKLLALGNAVRSRNGIWIAPVAPGFDARAVGGTSVVDRQNGDTLRAEWDAAMNSRPSAIGVISWNEFSENTHIEASKNYGHRYLDVLGELTGAPSPSGGGPDSSGSGYTGGAQRAVVALGGMAALVLVSLAVLVQRTRRTRRAESEPA